MKQIHLKITKEFERDLLRFMRHNRITNECEAIHQAVQEAATKSRAAHSDFRSWLGLGLKGPLNPNPRFRAEADL